MYKIKAKPSANEKVVKKFVDMGLTELEAELLVLRGLKTKKDALKFIKSEEIKDLSNGKLLSDIDKAIKEIIDCISAGKRILIYADYDSDGICSSVILEKSLKNYIKEKKSASEVITYIPNRILDGFGFKFRAVKDIDFDLLITVDNGISANSEFCLLKQKNPDVKIVVTDHHLLTNGLPEANAVVNCHREDDSYPNKNLCGASTIWLVMKYLYEKEKLSISFIEDLIAFCAIATITDVMDLSIENRIIVKKGLSVINSDKCPVGIKQLMIAMGIATVTAETIGFYIGPAINADGRLYDGTTAKSLLTGDESVAILKTYAETLVQINKERKEVKQKYMLMSDYYIEKNNLEENPFIAVAFPSAPEGIIGLIAGDIKEKYGVPAIVLTASSKDPDIFKGSGRSPEDYTVPFPEILSLTAEKNLLLKGGGHACACGLSVERKNLKDFVKVIRDYCEKNNKNFEAYRYYDKEVDFPTEELYTAGKILEPSGKANPPATYYSRNLSVVDFNYVGDGTHLVLNFEDDKGNFCRGIAFGKAKKYYNMGEPTSLSIVYTMQQDLEINIIDFEISEDLEKTKNMLISACKVQ